MTGQREYLTCNQLWKRFHKADERRSELYYKWKRLVHELHDNELRINLVKDAINAIHKKKDPDKLSFLDQDRLNFYHKELEKLKAHSAELHCLIIHNKEVCEEATVRANRYKMAWNKLKDIAVHNLPEEIETMQDRTNFIDFYTCSVLTEESGRLHIVTHGDDCHEIEFHF